jgi:anaerobic selenocysteine-containing dehydrogenase
VSGLPEFSGELPTAALAEEIDTRGEGRIRALIVHAGNPVLSAPNGPRLERALPGLDLMVCFDLYRNETTRHADYILPPTSPLESVEYDLAFSLLAVRNVAHFSPALFDPPAGARQDWEALAGLTTRLLARRGVRGRIAATVFGAVVKRLGAEGLLDIMLRLGPYGPLRSRRRLSLKTLKAHAHGLDLGPLVPRLPQRLFTPGKRIRLVHDLYVRDLERLRSQPSEPRDGLVLIGRRQQRSNNSWMHNSARLVKGKPRCTLMIHPADAADRSLEPGAVAVVRSRAGEVRLPVEITDTLMPGVVSIPHGWGHHREGLGWSTAEAHAGVSANDVTDERRVDRLSGTAAFNGVPVEVTAV